MHEIHATTVDGSLAKNACLDLVLRRAVNKVMLEGKVCLLPVSDTSYANRDAPPTCSFLTAGLKIKLVPHTQFQSRDVSKS